MSHYNYMVSMTPKNCAILCATNHVGMPEYAETNKHRFIVTRRLLDVPHTSPYMSKRNVSLVRAGQAQDGNRG